MKTPLEIAQSLIGTEEESRNRGRVIDTFWKDTNYTNGYINREPWCAAFVCYCVAEAVRSGWKMLSKFPPKDAAVRYFLKWAEGRKGVKVFRPSEEKPIPGDIVVFLPKLSHIGFVEKVEGDTLICIEGNTDDQGSREGTKVARRRRAKSFPGWIIRLETP